MDHRVQLPDIALHVTDSGSGMPLLLVHGFPLDHTMWSEQVAALSDRYRVIVPDLRGFGRSDVTQDIVSMDQFADDLDALLTALQIDQPVVLGGLSMGGYIGWSFYRRHRERLRGMILCDTKAAADVPAAAEMRRTNAERALAEGPEFLAESMLEKLFSRFTRAENGRVLETTTQVIREASPAGVAAALRGMAERSDATDLLAMIDLPTLLICGAEDVISTVDEMRGMAEAIPDAGFVEIPQAGHMSPLESPSAVNGAIREFLETTSAIC